jgi:glycosyltransferase involved in cell wall biosynthesis
MSKPLVSLTVFCYQAENFIQEAIDGALAQTYSPLEIIFTDDASTDRTFSIIKEAVKDYKGPHKIVLNRNEKNLGIGAHVSKIWFDVCQGDWIIVSAGDDVSLPNRVERLMEVAKPSLGAIHHRCICIDEDSNQLPFLPEYKPDEEIFAKNSVDELIRTRQWLKGATMCLNRQMLLKYGPINPDVVNEDNVLVYRAQDFGGILYLDEDLMLYRIHKQSVTNQFNDISIDNYMGRIVKNSRTSIALCKQVFDDSRKIRISPDVLKGLEDEKMKSEIDLFLFGNGKFNPRFLGHSWFYVKAIKRIFFKPYWYLLKSKQKPNI